MKKCKRLPVSFAAFWALQLAQEHDGATVTGSQTPDTSKGSAQQTMQLPREYPELRQQKHTALMLPLPPHTVSGYSLKKLDDLEWIHKR